MKNQFNIDKWDQMRQIFKDLFAQKSALEW